MSRNRAAKLLAATTGKRYVQALREIREARELCMATTHMDATCSPHCILAENVNPT